MKKTFLFLVASMISVSSFAKITVFTNEDVAIHVIRSAELARLKAPRGPLAGLQLSGLSVNQKGVGIGTVHSLTLNLSHVGIGFKSCSLNARVVTQRDPRSPQGIVSTKLSRPQLSAVKCAN